MLYPAWERNVQERRQLEMLTEWDRIHEPALAGRPAPDDVEPPPSLTSTGASSPDGTPPASPDSALSPVIIDGMAVLGAIVIDSIDLREPILGGATEKSLSLGIGTVVEHRSPGKTDNFVLAGHNSRKRGLHFSRLQELQPADTIRIETQSGSYIYKVTSTFLVKPDDLTVLDQDGTAQLTLITCDKVVNPTQRYIVRAAMTEAAADSEKREE